MRSISTGKAPSAVGPYSQAVECNGMVFVSGQLPIDPKDGTIPNTPSEQAGQVLRNIRSIAEASGCRMEDCVKVTIFLSDLSIFADVNSVYAESFSEPYPARSCVEVSGIPKGAMMEMDAIFVRST